MYICVSSESLTVAGFGLEKLTVISEHVILAFNDDYKKISLQKDTEKQQRLGKKNATRREWGES